eukprot:605370-Pelagomonas_calceolata.AAC.6
MHAYCAWATFVPWPEGESLQSQAQCPAPCLGDLCPSTLAACAATSPCGLCSGPTAPSPTCGAPRTHRRSPPPSEFCMEAVSDLPVYGPTAPSPVCPTCGAPGTNTRFLPPCEKLIVTASVLAEQNGYARITNTGKGKVGRCHGPPDLLRGPRLYAAAQLLRGQEGQVSGGVGHTHHCGGRAEGVQPVLQERDGHAALVGDVLSAGGLTLKATVYKRCAARNDVCREKDSPVRGVRV